MKDETGKPKKVKQPIAYTVGAPVAIVLFVSLLIGSVIVVRSMTNTARSSASRSGRSSRSCAPRWIRSSRPTTPNSPA
ncbi:MAG: hypothetical protein ACFHWZ_09910 [Phycisphaerales bacterium]